MTDIASGEVTTKKKAMMIPLLQGTLAIATPMVLKSKVVKSGQNWYFDRRGCGFAQSIDRPQTMAKPSTTELERRNQGSILSETDRTGFISNKKANSKHKTQFIERYLCRLPSLSRSAIEHERSTI